MESGSADNTFWAANHEWIIALAAITGAALLAWFVDRVLIKYALRRAERLAGEGSLTISRATNTRIRFARRLISALIIFIGVLIAIAQFESLSSLARALLASSAVIGIIIGFAGRAAFANPVAGIMLAVTQPFRIGDLIEFDGQEGRVEDLTLTYTYLRSADGRSIIIPNEMLATGMVFNSSRNPGGTGESPSVPLNTHES